MAGGGTTKSDFKGMPCPRHLILPSVATAHCLLGKDFQDRPIQAADWGGERDRCEYAPWKLAQAPAAGPTFCEQP